MKGLATLIITINVSCIGGGILWLSKIDSLASANSTELRLKRKDSEVLKSIHNELRDMNTRLSRIEGRLK